MIIIRLVLISLLAAAPAFAQVLPDRNLVTDPLADRTLDTAGRTWLNGARFVAEFGRYVPGDGDHRWNAKLGGIAEIVRWDSSANISIIGTMEVVVDPHNDITFNPRAIFWEEGLVAGFRVTPTSVFQAGYVHRCKHDIDNLELLERGESQQRTLIYSGLMTRLLFEPRAIVENDWRVDFSGWLRNDFFLHLLDSRIDVATRDDGRSIESLVDALTIGARMSARPAATWRIEAAVHGTFGLFGARTGFIERFSEMSLVASTLHAELGFSAFNPHGSAFTIFARFEHYDDAGIASSPSRSNNTLVGVRLNDVRGIW